ncbi:DEAD/DEAH box helicase [Gemmatimonas sp.]|uniref:DEAD/DEAH box helicase n=1 Tax=Gemmatimonas sp. TaxID=1962908 RepID=UPI0025BD8119|nr:DEAD/DEAH box helicase [Gemmatimonas sp.]MCA2987133.1 DEAD/DEAH box helicase [Gemmatimonas sp.]MCA2991839.1 DEAD/DEAH box helicase [Gemmatimonas sp.]
MRQTTDRFLPPDRESYLASKPATGRIIVIAPTRAACETIELAVGLHLDTFLERTRGDDLRRLAASGQGFGIVAGTGTGKTLAIRPIAETILATTDLRVGVVNREREATPETPTWNVVVVTTGIARRWFQDGDILPTDTLVVDEIHQTSAELELCLALGKRVGCRYIWLSATVDPTFYARYLDSADVLKVSAFDATKAAKVDVERKQPLAFLDDRFLQKLARSERGVAIFLPTRAGVEEAAEWVRHRFPRITAAHYHGGEPIRVIRPFLEGVVPKPFFLAMTAAGQSALNVPGLDTVIIDDTRFTNLIDRGRNVLTRVHLGANEILQMAGRVHGRVEGGRVYILSDRDIRFEALRPTEPEFQLAGDSERVALTCADLGVRADALDLPVPLDRAAYRKAVALLEARGLIENGRLTAYGRAVEKLPVERAWGELIVNGDDELLPALAVMSGVESLHRMTREGRDLEGLVVRGSDHLTAYNLYAEAFRVAGYIGDVYGLPRHLFEAERIAHWAEQRGVLVKALEDAALAMASVYRSVGMPLPQTLPIAGAAMHRRFADLLARYMPFDLVIEEETVDGHEARVSKTSVCGSWGAVAGSLRYFADRHGIPRAAIEGTQLSMDLVRQYAQRHEPELALDLERKHSPVLLRRRVTYFGFELSRDSEPLPVFPDALAAAARHLLAEAAARGELRHPGVRRNQPIVEEIREVWRRLGGITPRLGQAELTSWYAQRMGDARSWEDIRAMPLLLDRRDFLNEAQLAAARALPGAVEIRDRTVGIDYDVEELDGGRIPVARLRLPEKLARTLVPEELPVLDRALRFVVPRGQRGAVRANDLHELQDRLDLPFTDEERAAHDARGRGGAERGGRGESRGASSRGGKPGGGPRGGGRPGKGGRHPGRRRR